MNDILQLKGTMQERPHSSKTGPRNIPKKASAITSQKLNKLAEQLALLSIFWSDETVIQGCLIDVCYMDVIAKSNRIKGLLAVGTSANSSVVGARFADEEIRKHVITHHVEAGVIVDTIEKLCGAAKLLDAEFGGSITYDGIDSLGHKSIDYAKYGVGKTNFRNVIVDIHYVEGFKIPDNTANIDEQSIITVYRTSTKLAELMSRIGITVQSDKILSDTTLLLYPEEIKLLTDNAPYLIAMATEDLSKLSYEYVVEDIENQTAIIIDSPNGEPIIGVIDTLFDDSVYFSEWVEFKKMINEEIPTEPRDYFHGTSVTSIIVDGPAFNPELDDGCGRFRVRHFGVAVQGQYSAFTIMKSIQEIVVANPDIKVWNLSLGSDREINQNFISPEAAILDKIQFENDVIFVVAGTNKKDDDTTPEKRIGSPADSINSIIVNSVDKEGEPASYSRRGLVLSFFNKPDISSFGGDGDDRISVCTPMGEARRTGTSFAAPWVTRKVAYLIEVLGLSREVAKAMIVDSATGWNNVGSNVDLAPLIGHGVVPTRIEDIVQAADDEIKFVITGISEKWDTYTYNLPIPIHKDKHPFVAKATLCYFPSCSINQGVDYTNTELDVYFGRVNHDKIDSINKNRQSVADGEKHYIYEGTARKFYRKWDNTKHISKPLTPRVQPLKVYGNGMWGISIKSKERLYKRDGGIKFGLVVTLKEINGVNRINDFIHQCELRGWLINRVDVEAQIDIFNKAQEVVTFDT